MAHPYPSSAVLRALLDAGDPEATAHVRAALETAGTARAAAESLGVSERTAQRWATLVGLARRPGNPAWVTKSVTSSRRG